MVCVHLPLSGSLPLVPDWQATAANPPKSVMKSRRRRMHKMVVLAKAAEDRVEELARWYDERHIPDLLAVPGFVSAERHVVRPVKPLEGMPQWDFMLIYEISGDDPFAVLQTMGGMMGTDRMPTSDALLSEHTLSLVGLSEHRQDN
jgi:hypothetical protein